LIALRLHYFHFIITAIRLPLIFFVTLSCFDAIRHDIFAITPPRCQLATHYAISPPLPLFISTLRWLFAID